MTTILIIGGADTGRAPMAKALLRRIVERRKLPWQIDSAGVLGHDDDPPEPEARTAMLHLGIDISNYLARSLTQELMDEAAVLLAVDSGTARALRARFPDIAARFQHLGALAGRDRDIPDPFRMPIGAWMTYASELEQLLVAALPRLAELVPASESTPESTAILPNTTVAPTIPASATSPRRSALAAIAPLLVVAETMPDVLEWQAARTRLEAAIIPATTPTGPTDLAQAFGGLLRAALALTTNMPTTTQARHLANAFARLERSIDSDDLTWLSALIGRWAAT